MSDKYKLDGKTLVPCDDLIDWAKWFEKADRIVSNDQVRDARVSTVFLGVDHAFGNEHPQLFETMIFGGDREGERQRYATWDEAEAGHKRIVEELK